MKNTWCLIILTCLACNREKTLKQVGDSMSSKNDIVLIFNKRDFSKDTIHFPSGAYSPTIRPIMYTKINEYIEHDINTENIHNPDTIKIKTDKAIVLEHQYHYYYRSIYRFIPGDTIIFTYKDDAPYILNNKDKLLEYNFQTTYNLENPVPESRESFFLNHKRFRNPEENKAYWLKIYKSDSTKLAKLDSLHRFGNMSKSSARLISDYSIYFYPFFHLDNSKNAVKNDSLLSLSSYRAFVKNFSINKYGKKGKNDAQIDFPKLFDSIAKDSFSFSKNTKEYLLTTFLTDIANNGSLKTANEYFLKLKGHVLDSTTHSWLESKYLFNLKSTGKLNSKVVLVDRKKRKHFLQDILKRNDKSVAYLDFWASWCAPCLDAMPDSKELRISKESQVKFIYISVDKSFENWKKTSEKYGLWNLKDNYLAVNYPEVDFFKKNNLKTLPRYMVFDRNGELITSNAIGPEEIDLDVYLNK